MPRAPIGGDSPLQKPFLKAYAKTGKVDVAARAVGIGRATHYHWLRNRPGYREQFEALRAGWESGREERKEAALQRIGKIASLELIEDLEKLLRELLDAYSYGPKRKIKRREVSVKRTRRGLLDQIAKKGVFGVRYKDFDSAPDAAQQVIRAIAKNS